MHDAHSKSPDTIREQFKLWRKRSPSEILADPTLIDTSDPDSTRVTFLPALEISTEESGLGSSRGRLLHKPFEVNDLPGTLEGCSSSPG
jgi:hypothetical protein